MRLLGRKVISENGLVVDDDATHSITCQRAHSRHPMHHPSRPPAALSEHGLRSGPWQTVGTHRSGSPGGVYIKAGGGRGSRWCSRFRRWSQASTGSSSFRQQHTVSWGSKAAGSCGGTELPVAAWCTPEQQPSGSAATDFSHAGLLLGAGHARYAALDLFQPSGVSSCSRCDLSGCPKIMQRHHTLHTLQHADS